MALRGILNLPLEEDAIPVNENGIVDSIIEAEAVQRAPGIEIESYVD